MADVDNSCSLRGTSKALVICKKKGTKSFQVQSCRLACVVAGECNLNYHSK